MAGRGNPPGVGRPKGTPNKVTQTAKEMLEAAAEGAGGLATLTTFAKEKPEIFWPMWAKLLPKNVDVTSGGKPLNDAERTARLDALLAVIGKRAGG